MSDELPHNVKDYLRFIPLRFTHSGSKNGSILIFLQSKYAKIKLV